MRNFGKQHRKDRPFSVLHRRSPRGILPHTLFVIVFSTGLIFGPVLLFSYGCTERLPPDPVDDEPPLSVTDSSHVALALSPAGTLTAEEISHVDVLVYSDDSSGKLIGMSRLPYAGDALYVPSADGAVVVVAIANLPGRLNAAALGRFDTAELLQVDWRDDNPSRRVASGVCRMDVDGDCEAEISLLPVMSCVTLASVTNTMSGYVRLENPRVWLTGLNSSAEILRQDGFRPVETIEAGESVPLPCDVGFYTQYPDLTLWCYPNDTPELTLGVTRTGIVLECAIKGETCRFESDLPPIPRDGRILAELTVDSPTQGYWKFE